MKIRDAKTLENVNRNLLYELGTILQKYIAKLKPNNDVQWSTLISVNG